MALNKGFRQGLFIASVAVFAAASYVLIQYAQGHVFIVSERRFVRTGALTLDANEQVDVFLDGEPAGTTSVLAHEFSIGRLSPGTYDVRLSREGLSEWSKSVIVQEGLVTDFPRVLILSLDEMHASRSRAEIDAALARSFPRPAPSPSPTPSPPSPAPYTLVRGVLTMDGNQIATGVRGYQESPDGTKLMWWTRNEIGVRWLADAQEQPFRLAGEQEVITRLTVSIDRAAFWPDSYHVAVRSGARYRVLELDTRGGANIIEL